MKKLIVLISILLFLISCSSSTTVNVNHELMNPETFKITEYSTDKTYGYTEKNPIKVGGMSNSEGPLNERRFLNALTGPNGEKISYSRLGSCCAFKTRNGSFDNTGLLDKYEIKYEGQEKEIIIYINMYDKGELKAPVGFKLKYQ